MLGSAAVKRVSGQPPSIENDVRPDPRSVRFQDGCALLGKVGTFVLSDSRPRGTPMKSLGEFLRCWDPLASLRGI